MGGEEELHGEREGREGGERCHLLVTMVIICVLSFIPFSVGSELGWGRRVLGVESSQRPSAQEHGETEEGAGWVQRGRVLR